MKKLIYAYSMTALAILLVGILVGLFVALNQPAVLMYTTAGLLLVCAFLADFVVNYQIKQETNLQAYKEMWDKMKTKVSPGGPVFNKHLYQEMNRMENSHLKNQKEAVNKFIEGFEDVN